MEHTFLLITPDSWTEIADAHAFTQQYLSYEDCVSIISENRLYELTNALENAGILPVGYIVAQARIFKDDIVHLWVIYQHE